MRKHKFQGASLTQYAIILLVIIGCIIAIYYTLGQTINEQLGSLLSFQESNNKELSKNAALQSVKTSHSGIITGGNGTLDNPSKKLC